MIYRWGTCASQAQLADDLVVFVLAAACASIGVWWLRRPLSYCGSSCTWTVLTCPASWSYFAQVVGVQQGPLQDAEEDRQPDSTAGRSKRQKQVPQRTAVAAARLRRPAQRGASAGVAAAVEAAAADSLEGVGTDDEAVAVASAAAAVAAQRGWLETEPGGCSCGITCSAVVSRLCSACAGPAGCSALHHWVGLVLPMIGILCVDGRGLWVASLRLMPASCTGHCQHAGHG
jgi:hypothetical protein